LSNAIKFTEGGQVSVLLSGSAPRADGRIEITFSVADTGVGIPEDKLQSIFQPFTQAEFSTTRQYGGTGLGLTIVTRLVELMEGKISVESQLGKGSTFTFSALVEPINETATSQLQGRNAPPENRRSAKPLSILLAEDNIVNQKVAQGLLGKQGHRVVIASNGLEAVTLFRQTSDQADQAFDVILMDVHMPEMDGYEATKLIREQEMQAAQPNHIPIVALTANASEGDRQCCLDAGMDDFVSKPFKIADLNTVLDRLIP
jgi:CheY-like chemotaxis protein